MNLAEKTKLEPKRVRKGQHHHHELLEDTTFEIVMGSVARDTRAFRAKALTNRGKQESKLHRRNVACTIKVKNQRDAQTKHVTAAKTHQIPGISWDISYFV